MKDLADEIENNARELDSCLRNRHFFEEYVESLITDHRELFQKSGLSVPSLDELRLRLKADEKAVCSIGYSSEGTYLELISQLADQIRGSGAKTN